MATSTHIRKHLRKLILAGAILSTFLAFAETGATEWLLDAPLSRRIPLILMFGQADHQATHARSPSIPFRQNFAQHIAMNAPPPQEEHC